ncbi:MAG: UbiA family prenyltransferase, partial [Deltaproteobacteria bacterium]
LFVVGGKNSANSRRLTDLAQKQQTPTFHIETATEIGNINIDPYDRIGVSAGASTPNWIIDRVMDRIAEGQNRKLKKVGSFLNLWILAIKTDIYSAVGAGCLCLACMVLQNIPVNISSITIASFFTYAMHVLNRLISRKPPVGFIGSFREETYLLHEKRYLYSAVVCVLVALILAYNNGIIPFTFLFIIALAGILYNMKLLPGGWRFQSLKDLPGSKNIFMAAAWGTVTAILPALNNNSLHAALIIAFVFTFGVVFIRSAISDILEIQSDKLIGRETIPVLFGKETTLALLKIISLILLVLLTMSNPVGWTTTLSFFLISCILYIWICFQLCDRKSGFSGAVMEGLLETSYIIAGLSVLVWFFAH